MIQVNPTSPSNADAVKTKYSSVEPGSKRIVKATDFAKDISGYVMDNKAYQGQGKTAAEVMQAAGGQDVTLMQNMMTAMSNFMSEEDFAKFCEDGYEPGEMDLATSVTVMDEIKTALAQAGIVINGYNDDLDIEKLKEITGSISAAQAIENAFRKEDVPITKENAEETGVLFKQATELGEMTDGICDYLLRNGIEPTIDHVYRVRFSGAQAENRNHKGYYSEEVGGYLTKQAEEYNWEGMHSRLCETIEEAGLEVNEETLNEAKWLVESGILLNARNVGTLHSLQQVTFPLGESDIATAAARAIADGKGAKGAMVFPTESLLERAISIEEAVAKLSEQAADFVSAEGQPLTILNLTLAEANSQGKSVPVNEDARRLLEEVRLKMTVESSYRLLKQGIQIDTTELSQLVEALKNQESIKDEALFGSEDAISKGNLLRETQETLRQIPFLPAAVLGEATESQENETLRFIHKSGIRLESEYRKAGESYEALRTEVRKDLGDTVSKAFRNVDALLEENDLETSDENRRAVRILGYNQMEISTDNVERIRNADEKLSRVMDKMTPSSTLKLIRDGNNPLELPLDELEKKLDDMQSEPLAQVEKYSKFLFRLEQNKEITSEEREAYIGIYRLVDKIEKSDGAVVGAIVNSNAEFNFKNLLSAVRTSKVNGMDYKVNDSFGERSADDTVQNSISEQILTGFVKATAISESTKHEYVSQKLEEVRINWKVSDVAVEELVSKQHAVTSDALHAMEMILANNSEGFNKLNEQAKRNGKKAITDEMRVETESETEETFFEQTARELLQHFDSAKEGQQAYQQLTQIAGDILKDSIYSDETGRIDLKALASSYKQLALANDLARDEEYQIPVEVNGSFIGIHVKIVHRTEKEGTVTATFDSKEYGKIGARFQINGNEVSGYISGESEEGIRKLEASEAFTERLSKEGKAITDLRYISSENLDLSYFHLRNKGNEDQKTATADLYKVAKAFIISIQDAEKKGVTNESRV